MTTRRRVGVAVAAWLVAAMTRGAGPGRGDQPGRANKPGWSPGGPARDLARAGRHDARVRQRRRVAVPAGRLGRGGGQPGRPVGDLPRDARRRADTSGRRPAGGSPGRNHHPDLPGAGAGHRHLRRTRRAGRGRRTQRLRGRVARRVRAHQRHAHPHDHALAAWQRPVVPPEWDAHGQRSGPGRRQVLGPAPSAALGGREHPGLPVGRLRRAGFPVHRRCLRPPAGHRAGRRRERPDGIDRRGACPRRVRLAGRLG